MAQKHWGFIFLSWVLFSESASAAIFCSDLLSQSNVTLPQLLFKDSRLSYDETVASQKSPLVQIGEGNSATSYLFRDRDGQFKVMKIYKPERQQALVRDHLGLRQVQDFFNLDRQHSSQLRVVSSEIRDLSDGKRVLILPYVPGIDLHRFLIQTVDGHTLRQTAIELYNKMIEELHTYAQRSGLQDELRIETDKYFRDHLVDGMMMLKIFGSPDLLIKTDNIIFNPEDNSLTLIDPY